MNKTVSDRYLGLRKTVLEYDASDMNLMLEKDDQVYIAVIDIPTGSGLLMRHVKTLALVFGLNTHVYYGDGQAFVGLEKNHEVMKAMQSFFISVPQILPYMKKCADIKYKDSENLRVFLKTRIGIYEKELQPGRREDEFLRMLIFNIEKNIVNALD